MEKERRRDMKYIEENLQPGDLPIYEFDHSIFVIEENGEEVKKLEPKDGKVTVPLFEIAGSIDVVDNVGLISQQLNETYNKLEILKSKLVESGCNTVCSLVRTNWTFLPSFGMSNGPVHEYKTAEEMLEKAQSHNCSVRNIFSINFAKDLKVGFACNCGLCWVIRLLDLKQDKLKNLFRTNESRDNLGKQLNSCDYFPNLELDLEMSKEGNGIDPNKIHMFTTRCLYGF